MLYFTRGWASGEVDDSEAARVEKAYEDRLATLAPRMPQALRTLAFDVDVHDAIIDQVRWHLVARELTLVLATAPDEGECRSVTLTFRGALLGERRLEVDIDGEGLLVHRLLFWPRDELTIEFTELRVAIAPRPDRRVNLGPAFQEIDEDA